jgi:hypothetical protein
MSEDIRQSMFIPFFVRFLSSQLGMVLRDRQSGARVASLRIDVAQMGTGYGFLTLLASNQAVERG